MFTAIVLDTLSQIRTRERALALNLFHGGADVKCHHVTLTMGTGPFVIDEERTLTVTHYGITAGRVSAFAVSGAADSKNKVPHVTIATFNGAKPRESNDIADWMPLAEPFEIKGRVQICH